MFDKHALIYLLLSGILIILIFAVVIFPSRNQSIKPVQPNFPTPTMVQILPASPPTSSLPQISPTNTGGNEELPTDIKDLSSEKQVLRRKTPLTTPNFTIIFDYANDNFIVTPTSQTPPISQIFPAWLRQNYPLIPISQFNFK